MIDVSALDNPIWSALTTAHRGLALSTALAARYVGGVASLVALGEPTSAAFADLHALVDPGVTFALFTDAALAVPDDWTVVRSRLIDQMICAEPTWDAPVNSRPPLSLGEKDVPDMLALTALTEPGPFLAQAIRMGNYYGVRSNDGRLAAMAGRRLTADSFVEVSAVCTDPEFRGKGLAGSLVRFLVDEIRSEGKLPILHVKTENGAKVLYDKLGFKVRRAVQLTVIRRE